MPSSFQFYAVLPDIIKKEKRKERRKEEKKERERQKVRKKRGR